MPRLVRRAPLLERIQAQLNLWDFLLWLSEELNSNEWANLQKDLAVPLGVGMNIFFMVARANSGNGGRSRADDVFGDYPARAGSGWFAWFVSDARINLVCMKG